MFVFIPLNTKIKLFLYKTDSEWEDSVWRMENVSNYIDSYSTFEIQLYISTVGGLLCIYAELNLFQAVPADRNSFLVGKLSLSITLLRRSFERL